MRKLILMMVGVMFFISTNIIPASAKTTEMRAAWVTTVYNQDWPKTKNNVDQQKQEFIQTLDKLKSIGINTVMVQIRPKSDALYKSNINPWSDVLTGTQGKDPGYDPLAFMIEEAHKRGMELHGWLNPYRVTTKGTDLNALSSNHPARNNPSWVVTHGTAMYYDPGNPEVRKYLVDTVMEVVKNYNINGIHFDDYFYPGTDFNDNDSYSKHGNGMDKGDWRRNNVNLLVKEVNSSINSAKPSVDFGISPAGIWKNKSSDPNGSDTRGNESYSAHYADSVSWIKNEWVDYIAPQIYWNIGHSAADYAVLTEWWAKQVKGTNIDLYIGQGVYKPEVASEIGKQINHNRKYSEIKGSIFFSTKHIMEDANLQNQIKNVYLDNINRYKIIGSDRYETSAMVSRTGWDKGTETVLLVNGFALADGITATPLASIYNAPILLTKKEGLDIATINELKRLSPKNVILIGGDGVISNNVISDIKNINGNINVSRIGGSDRYATSLLIAQKIDSMVDVNKAYVCYGLGEADALSISSKAGIDKSPIILTQTKALDNANYNWLKSENLETAYFIGGEPIINNSVINQVNGITKSNVVNNRVAGSDRFETNAEVVKRFFTSESQPVVMATKGLQLADALTSGPLAAKNNGPIILLNDSLSSGQKAILKTKYSNTLYQIGGGINESAITELIGLIN
ncbi:MAG: family 10 glycosylhydrolase [Clostridium sp.]